MATSSMAMSKKHIYVSIDIEADGPIPGPFSMLQFGAAAFDLTSDTPRDPIATFEVNLDLLLEATQSPDTMAWWDKQGDAYANTRKFPKDPAQAMPFFLSWLRTLPGAPTIIGYPITFDFSWLYWYTMKFGGLADGERCPFGFQGLDIKALAWTRMGGSFRGTSKRRMPKHWFEGTPKHNHDGLTDAIGQGILFVNIMLDRQRALDKA